MSEMDFLIDWITSLGVIAVAVVIFAESGLLIGFFLPGDSLLFTAGFLTQQGVLAINIHLLVGLLFFAAALGDSFGYTFGRKVGRRLFKRKDSLLFHHDNLIRAENFYEKHGAVTIVIARFIPVIRTFAPIVAGIGKMRYRQFVAYNVIGALLWAVGLTYLGYYVGAWFESRGINIDNYLLPIIAFIIVLSFLPPIIHVLRDPNSRTQLREAIKNLWKRLRK